MIPTMTNPPDPQTVLAVLQQINRAWLEGRPEDILPFLHPEMAMVFPGFGGRTEGAEALIAGFQDFCQNAKVLSYAESDHQADLAGNSAVASFRFEMVYARGGASYRSTGRDLWVFERRGDGWLAVWRTMLDVAEEPAVL
jgi:ketosteroid isomerase-like protein